jgi:hypothetical protein
VLILGGASKDEVQTNLDRLTPASRQAVLCTARYLLDEIATNCRERAEEIEAVIETHCPNCRAGEGCASAARRVIGFQQPRIGV